MAIRKLYNIIIEKFYCNSAKVLFQNFKFVVYYKIIKNVHPRPRDKQLLVSFTNKRKKILKGNQVHLLYKICIIIQPLYLKFELS